MTIVPDHKLIIMRHAKSDWSGDFEHDFERPLSERGIRDASRMANWFAGSGLIPDLYISSPAVRARHTALIVADGIAYDHNEIVWDNNIYDASMGDLLRVIETNAGDHQCILLIGHNPGLDKLLCYLSINEPERTLSGKLMTTSAAAILNFNDRHVETVNQSANLERLLRPGTLV